MKTRSAAITVMLGHKLAVVVSVASGYFVLYEFTRVLFRELASSAGFFVVFLPAGLCMLSMLVFAETAAIGIGIGTMLVCHLHVPDSDAIAVVSAGLSSGAAACLGLDLSRWMLRFDDAPSRLTAANLLKMVFIFAATTVAIRVCWFAFIGRTEDLVQRAASMAFGEVSGALVVLYVAKLVLKPNPVSDR